MHKNCGNISAPTQQEFSQNRAFRRRARARWERDMRTLIKDAAGVFAAQVIRVGGPKPSYQTFEKIVHWANAVLDGELDPLCLSCDTDIGLTAPPPDAWVVVEPKRNDASTGCVVGVCPACAARQTDDELCAHVAAWFKGRLLSAAHMSSLAGRA